MEISANIRRLREGAGMTQEQLAAKLGIDRVSVTHWENGTTVPRMGNVEKMARIFGVGKSEIIDGPASDAKMELSPDELALLETYRAASPVAKKAMLATVGALADNIGEGLGFSDAQVTVRTA